MFLKAVISMRIFSEKSFDKQSNLSVESPAGLAVQILDTGVSVGPSNLKQTRPYRTGVRDRSNITAHARH